MTVAGRGFELQVKTKGIVTGRRKKSSVLEDLMDVVALLPWQSGVGPAIGRSVASLDADGR